MCPSRATVPMAPSWRSMPTAARTAADLQSLYPSDLHFPSEEEAKEAAEALYSLAESVALADKIEFDAEEGVINDKEQKQAQKEAAAFRFASASATYTAASATYTALATARDTAYAINESIAAYSPSALVGTVGTYFATPETPPPLLFFSAWFCPFAQRAHIALEYKKVPYEYVECALYQEGTRAPHKVALSLEEKRRLNPEFVRTSPSGQVPAFHDQARDGRMNGSHLCTLYVEEAFPGPPLLPADPALRAHMRLAINHFDEKVRPYFYALLQCQDKAGREHAAAELTAGWANLADRMDPSGPYFCGEQFSCFECATLPWFQRIEMVLGHYREHFRRAADGEGPVIQRNERLKKWYGACLAHPAYQKTICDRERLINNYSGYMDRSEKDTARNSWWRWRRTMASPNVESKTIKNSGSGGSEGTADAGKNALQIVGMVDGGIALAQDFSEFEEKLAATKLAVKQQEHHHHQQQQRSEQAARSQSQRGRIMVACTTTVVVAAAAAVARVKQG